MAGTYFGLLALGSALAASLAAIGAGIGEGLLFAAAITSIARQPEAEGRIRTLMFITFGMVETLFIFGFIIFLLLFTKLPNADQITAMLK